MSDIHDRLLAAFEFEHREHLEAVREWLAGLETGQQLDDSEGLEEATRRVHSLKGAARAVGMRVVEAIAHELESLLGGLGRGDMELPSGLRRLIEAALERIEDCVSAARAGKPVPDNNDILERLSSAKGGGAPPRAEEARRARRAEGPQPPGRTVPQSAREAESVRVNVATLDRLLETAGEIGTQALGLEEVTRAIRECLTAGHRLAAEDGTEASRKTSRELVQRLRGVLNAHRAAAWRQRRAADRLRVKATQARMVSARSEFGGARAMARSLARDAGKEVQVIVSGLDAVADRNVLQALRDPVNHMLRNAVSHGIERPAARRRAGKPAEGRVTLEFRSDSTRLCVRATDDGAGLDAQAIREQAKAAGLIAANDTELPAGRMLELICNAGLSTAEQVTEVAGRGIGMSVVQRAVSEMQGTLTAESEPGAGTRFEILVPVTTTSTRVVLVTAGEQVYALPSHVVRRILHLSADELREADGAELKVSLAGEDAPVPVIRFNDWLGVQGVPPADGGHAWGVLLGENDERRCLLVDGVHAVRDEVVNRLPPPAHRMEHVTGAVRLEDGRVAPCLNAGGITRATAARAAPPPRREPRVAPHVLVVDDSLTTRTLERSILDARGYRVSVCVDGREAWEFLRQNEVDLVIADVEMPHMDGFALLERMKFDERLANIPVIMVTSRGSDEDRRRGLDLGADAYLVKKSFDQAELLEAVGQLT